MKFGKKVASILLLAVLITMVPHLSQRADAADQILVTTASKTMLWLIYNCRRLIIAIGPTYIFTIALMLPDAIRDLKEENTVMRGPFDGDSTPSQRADAEDKPPTTNQNDWFQQ